MPAEPDHPDLDGVPRVTWAEGLLHALRARHPAWVIFGMAGQWCARKQPPGGEPVTLTAPSSHLLEQKIIDWDARHRTRDHHQPELMRPYVHADAPIPLPVNTDPATRQRTAP
ncbi:hypothetical protein [Actinomadura fulvescens]|uniref:hypothetical protein n=1 Tax=Actinomadura fulvescens TaxID=46160 RepID=UPI0031DBF963